jgi:hypothetical protein
VLATPLTTLAFVMALPPTMLAFVMALPLTMLATDLVLRYYTPDFDPEQCFRKPVQFQQFQSNLHQLQSQ